MSYIFYFIITIALLVFVHELGHFLAARLCKMRTDVFAIGFGKRLLGWNRINGFTTGSLPEDLDMQGHTDYRISLIPLGGYVKIVGMVDESFDTSFAGKDPEPYEFRSKPTYQKLFTISAGILMNLLLTLMIFWALNFYQGRPEIMSTQIGVVPDTSVAAKAGFREGDVIKSINGADVTTWQDVMTSFLIEATDSDLEVEINRSGRDTSFSFSREILAENKPENFFLFVGPSAVYIPAVIENSPAEDAGILAEDIFLEINGQPLTSTSEAIAIINNNAENEIQIKVLRGQDTLLVSATPDMNGRIGINISSMYNGPIEYRTFGFFQSFTMAVENVGQYTYLTFRMMKNVIGGQLAFDQAFGGPVKIAQYAQRSADAGPMSFLFFIAMLSLSLAIFNMMPFPAMDGGHFIIILIEGIIRKEIPLKAKIAIQNFGFVILLLLMAFIIYSDILSVF